MAQAAGPRTVTPRQTVLAFTAVSVAVVALTASVKFPTRLIWNASASVPIGLYAVRPVGLLHVGELVVVTPPEPLASFLADRGYLPEGMPLLKHILALPRQTVCRIGDNISIDGVPVGRALARDRRGRLLPAWQGCRAIRDGEVFLMNRRPEDSLDGRYFGPVPAAAITGRADPLWINNRN
jgi:conjugative transfer signal peptidase TraF